MFHDNLYWTNCTRLFPKHPSFSPSNMARSLGITLSASLTSSSFMRRYRVIDEDGSAHLWLFNRKDPAIRSIAKQTINLGRGQQTIGHSSTMETRKQNFVVLKPTGKVKQIDPSVVIQMLKFCWTHCLGAREYTCRRVFLHVNVRALACFCFRGFTAGIEQQHTLMQLLPSPSRSRNDETGSDCIEIR